MKSRPEIKMQAKANFSAQYGIALGAYLLFVLLGAAAGGITFGIGALLLMPPLLVGYCFFNIRIYKGEKAEIDGLFSAGFTDYGRNLGGVLWMYLFIFLWSLLFIIPGIIKAISYFMTPYILAESKKLDPTRVLKLSMKMTNGYKGEIFVMALSFIGWILLSALTFGLLQLFFAGPYMSASFAGMYSELRQNAISKGIVTEEELA